MKPPSLHRALPIALMLIALPVAAAPDARGKGLHCNVDSSLSCSGDQCERVPEEYTYLIDLVLSPGDDGGNLCTGTYCRPFEWLPLLGDNSPLRTFGPIRSASSGSTDDLLDIPKVDYHLWISVDRKRFALLPLDPSGGTWVGGCKPQE